MIKKMQWAQKWAIRRSRGLARNEDGVVALEFAIVSVPFVMLIFGFMSICLYFFTVVSVESGVWLASRDLRTGAFQTGMGDYASLTGDALKDKFKQKLCDRMPSHIASDCAANMRVLVQARSAYSGVTEPSCTTGSGASTALVTETAAKASFDAGSQNNVIIVTACYSWDFATALPLFTLPGSLGSGAYLIQASATFRAEPYN